MAPLPLTVATAAIRVGDTIHTTPRPGRHPHIVIDLFERFGPEWAGDEPETQGFVLSDGTFADRRKAMEVASAAGQLTKPPVGSELFSEDLW